MRPRPDRRRVLARGLSLALGPGVAVRAGVVAGAAGAWAAAGAAGAASDYPSRPIKLVVPAPPGGLTDTVARLLADAMRPSLGQPLVVDNRPGAAGLLGTQAVAEAPADGYTLLATSTSNHALAPLTQRAARVDPQQDLRPVGLVLRAVGILAVPADLPVRTLPEFIALARRSPGRLNYASSGIGSANHVHTERFKALAGIDIVHVPYRGGGPLLQALMAGEVQFALIDYASAESALQSGRVRALVQSGARRHVALPAVPTLAEAGYAAYDPAFWIGLAAPRATPQPVADRVTAALRTALDQAAVKARAQAFGWALADGSPQALADVARRDADAFRAEIGRLQLDRQ